MADAAEAIARTTLASGLRVVTETMPDVRSVAVGFWVDVGSRDEDDDLAGATHFLEHLLFKGTPRRTAQEIAEAVEAVGGEMNAFTTHDYTAYYIRVLDECLDLALDILSDIMWSPALRIDDIESERQVILEEIRMRDDTPEDMVHDLLGHALFPGHPLGREVIGSPKTVESTTRDEIAAYHATHYRAPSVVVAAAGNLSHQAVVDGVGARFVGRADHPPRHREAPSSPPEPLEVWSRPTEQAHVVVGVPAFPRDDPDRYALSVLNQALGGGMSSRLFQEIRERRGLAYSVYSYRSLFEDAGYLAAYAGTAPRQAREVVGLIHEELDRLVHDGGLASHELDRAKGNLRGGMALSQESPNARMHRIGRSELTLGEVPSVDELSDRIDAVGPDDVARVIDRLLAPGVRTLAAVGPFEDGAFAGA